MPHLSKTAVHKIIHISEFPRIPESKRVDESGVEHYAVPSDIFVPSYSNGCSAIKPVTEFTIHPGCKEHVVTTKLGRSLICSEHHSLATLNWDTLVVEQTDAIDAVNKMAPVLRGYADSTITTLPGYITRDANRARPMMPVVELDHTSGWFIGATIGDGWFSSKVSLVNFSGKNKLVSESEAAALCFAYGKEDSPVAAQWRSTAKLLAIQPDAKITVTKSNHKFEGFDCMSYKSTVTSTALSRFMEPLIGHLAEGKHLPPDFMNMPLDFRRGLLTGLLDTDGTLCWTHDKGIGKKKPQFACAYTTISGRLAGEIKFLAMSLGLMATITVSQHNKKPVYLLSFSTGPIRDASWLKLLTDSKQTALERLQKNTETMRGHTDIVPLPPKIKEEALVHLRSCGAAKKVGKNRVAYNAYIDIYSRNFAISRSTCAALLKALESQHEHFSEYFARWIALVNNQNIGWDQITDVKCTGELKTMYDITVPNSWTFCTDDGLYIWDSMNFHVPVSDKAVSQANEKMLPSKNLFSLTDLHTVRHSPQQELALGLYMLTRKPTNKPVQRFASAAEARRAYGAGKIDANDPIEIMG